MRWLLSRGVGLLVCLCMLWFVLLYGVLSLVQCVKLCLCKEQWFLLSSPCGCCAAPCCVSLRSLLMRVGAARLMLHGVRRTPPGHGTTTTEALSSSAPLGTQMVSCWGACLAFPGFRCCCVICWIVASSFCWCLQQQAVCWLC